MTEAEGFGWLRRAARRSRRAVSSIRVRIVVGYLVLMTVGLAVAVLVTRQVQLARSEREIERDQAQEVEELRLLAREGIDPATGERFGGDVARIFDTFLRRNVPSDDEAFYTIIGGQGYLYSNSSPNLFTDPQFVARWADVTTPTSWITSSEVGDVGEVRSLAVPIEVGDEVSGVFVVASFPANDVREVGQVVRLITLSGLAVLVVTSVLAWSLAGRVLRPVRELSSTARSISDDELSARIPVEGHDELAELGHTFNDMVDRLENGFRAQRRFLDDVAHELRTPITIARGHLEVLGDDPAERADTVEIVTDELDHMSRYVNDLLTLAAAEQPDFLAIGPLDLGELATDVHHRARALGDRKWVLDQALPPGLLALSADAERLGQALLNLAANAVQHTQPGDEIGLGFTGRNDQVRLWVRDTGPGVDPAVAGCLFDRYSRSATSRSRRPAGSGIGLSIVDAIARAHGGWVEVDTAPGAGATFTLVVPAPTPVDTVGRWAPPIAPPVSQESS